MKKDKRVRNEKICTIILGNKVLCILIAQIFLILKNLRLFNKEEYKRIKM